MLADERRCIPPHIALDFGNQGLFGLLIEERYGGLALRMTDVARVLEQLAAIDLGLATWHLTSLFPGTRALSVGAGEEFAAEWLPRLAEGRVLGAYAQTEPNAGSDFTGISTLARPTRDGGWRLSGDKVWIGNGSWAGVVTVIAHLADAKGAPVDIAAFGIPMSSTGARAGAEHLSMGLRGMVQSHLHFDDVAVGPHQLLDGGQGMRVALDSMTMGRFALAAASLGAMKRCLQLAHRFGSRRVISGRRLCDRAATLEALGEVAAHVQIGEAVVYGLADILDTGGAIELEQVVAAKVMMTEWLGHAADRLLQLLGGRGFDEANAASRLYRDVRVYRIFEGATEALVDFLGARATMHPARIDRQLRSAGAPDVADRLRDAVAELGRRNVTQHGPDIDQDWRNAVAGTALMWAFAVTALRTRNDRDTHAAVIAEHRFEQALSEVRSGGPREIAVASPAELAMIVDGCTSRIGDIEETLPGPSTQLDPLLRSHSSL
ncbi:acyl-CoA dehydrogenase family protein [Streptomyces sp. NPDC051546]|uniref:acyl-CoA dehydrogenase family protein n=1 Tax=Streptomyces sp. NPDC051546 TaxID=3365655 RepID=UPI00379FA60E